MRYELLLEGAKIIKKTFQEIKPLLIPGISLKEIDKVCEENITKMGAESAPKKVYNFPSFSCIGINNVACHGKARDILLSSGDLVSIDISIYYKGVFLDIGRSYVVKDVLKTTNKDIIRKENLVNMNRDLVRSNIKKLKIKDKVNILEDNLEKTVKDLNFTKKYNFLPEEIGVVTEYVGHFIGEDLHMDPTIESVRSSNRNKKKFINNDIFCCEPILGIHNKKENIGNLEILTKIIDDEVVTKNNEITSHWEEMVVVKDNKFIILFEDLL